VAGRKFWFNLAVGADETRYAKQRGQQSAMITMLLQRVTQIEGVEDHVRRKFIEDSEFRVLTSMLDEMDHRDCGVATSFDVECPDCGVQSMVNLPFERGFLFPETKPRAR
jgi:hypothetical protein